MTNYRINQDTNTFQICYPDTIEIGLFDLDILTDDEQIRLIADALMHEHIHEILYKLFNRPVSALFDAMEHHFLDRTLEQRYLDTTNAYGTYQKLITNEGFDAFLSYKHITIYEFDQSHILCNNRSVAGGD